MFWVGGISTQAFFASKVSGRGNVGWGSRCMAVIFPRVFLFTKDCLVMFIHSVRFGVLVLIGCGLLNHVLASTPAPKLRELTTGTEA